MRHKLRDPGGNYTPPDRDIDFISSGCALLDCTLGGGWPLGRICNIVGDKSVGKTLLAIEAAHNFAVAYPKGFVWYRESEAAFDLDYATTLGLPLDRVDFGPQGIHSRWDTVEDIFEDLDRCTSAARKKAVPGLYIIDSLDALSSRARMARKIDKGSFGLEKPKKINELLERFTRELREINVCLLIVSQVRQNINALYGEKYTRSGGKGLDFYCSQIVWLKHIKTLTQTQHKMTRATAVRVRAKCKKNKITRPFNECEFVLRFHYGVDDLQGNLEWLSECGRLKELGPMAKQVEHVDKMNILEYRAFAKHVDGVVRRVWDDVDRGFMPKHSKYEAV